MSFDSLENSLTHSRPVRLYLFERGSLAWAYTSAQKDIEFGGHEYEPTAIDDAGIRLTGQASADMLTITAPGTITPALMYRGAPPSDPVYVEVRDWHYATPDLPESVVIAWSGLIVGVGWPEPDRAQMKCVSLDATLRYSGLYITVQRMCPYSAYDLNCKVERALHRVETVIDAMDGETIECAEAQPEHANGFVEWEIAGGITEKRGISAVDGTKLTILGGTDGMEIGMTVLLYQGCENTRAVCLGRFGNLNEYGGFAHMPGKSPFDGDPIF